jgi:tetratricopeptide (TPR) repeat protein
MSVEQKQSIVVFFSYAKRDKLLRDRLEEHLSNLKYRGLITTWHDREILAGMNWLEQVDLALRNAQIILLLISSAFMSSDYCYGKEMQEALHLHKQKKAAVIPILLRPVLFTDAPFAQLSMLPTNGKPVTKWHDRDSAFVDVVLSIERVIKHYLQRSISERFSPTRFIESVDVQEAPRTPRDAIIGDNVSSFDIQRVFSVPVSLDRHPMKDDIQRGDRCPYCAAETRPGDNFCLNCGNRLPTVASVQQAPANVGDATMPAENDWAMPTARVGLGSGPVILNKAPTRHAEQPVFSSIENPARLTLRTGTGEFLRYYVLEKLKVSIGRAPNSDILLSKDRLTSRIHAIIVYKNQEYVLTDEGSANGTFVNGQQLEAKSPYKLRDGDHLGIGEYELIFHTTATSNVDMESMPTIMVAAGTQTYTTNDDPHLTNSTSDEFGTRPWEGDMASISQIPMAVESLEKTPLRDTTSLEADIASSAFANVESWDGTFKGFGEPAERQGRLVVEAVQRAYYTESVSAYEHALSKNPRDIEALLGMGKALYRLARYDEAFNVFRRSLLYQETPLAYAGLGDIYVRQRRYEEAIAVYEKARQLDSHVALNYADFVHALQKVGKVSEAVQMKEMAEELGYFDDEEEDSEN